MSKRRTRRSLFLIAALVTSLITIPATAVQLDAVEKYAWGENVGWVSHREGAGEVLVYGDHLEGYAWAENIGWIRFGVHTGGSKHSYANTSANDWGVNRQADGSLSGFAWAENIGWIDFAPPYGGVSIELATGKFTGYAWSENVGWIGFGDLGGDYGASLIKTDLMVAQQADAGPLQAGSPLIYSVTIRNQGDYAADEVAAKMTLASGVSFVATEGDCLEADQGVPICTLGRLEPGQTKSYKIRVVIAPYASGSLLSVVQINALSGDPDITNNTARATTLVSIDWDLDGLPDAWDPVPKVAQSNSCSGSDVLLRNWLIRAGDIISCRSTNSIHLTSSVRVESGGILALVSPTITTEAGFRAASGSRFRAFASAPSRASQAAPDAQPTIIEQPSNSTKANTGHTLRVPKRLDGSDLPKGLLAHLGTSDRPEYFYSDAEGEYIVFVSNAPLLKADTNHFEDIYLYETFSDELLLISKTAQGKAGAGASIDPVIDGYGAYIVFSSTAEDLTTDAADGVSDIFLYYVGLDYLTRISRRDDGADALPSTRPAMDAAAVRVIYERGEQGRRSIVSMDPLQPHLGTQVLTHSEDLAELDQHHPGISADGQYSVWIAETAQDCQIVVQDAAATSNRIIPCPFASADHSVDSPWFDEEHDAIIWKTTHEDGSSREYRVNY